MAMSSESIKSQALRCSIMMSNDGESEQDIIERANRFSNWIAGGMLPQASTGGIPLPPTPGELAMMAPAPQKMKGQPAHQPPCHLGMCPACDAARARGEI